MRRACQRAFPSSHARQVSYPHLASQRPTPDKSAAHTWRANSHGWENGYRAWADPGVNRHATHIDGPAYWQIIHPEAATKPLGSQVVRPERVCYLLGTHRLFVGNTYVICPEHIGELLETHRLFTSNSQVSTYGLLTCQPWELHGIERLAGALSHGERPSSVGPGHCKVDFPRLTQIGPT